MALQGTLDTFALIDVFRLLASTNKTGRLRVTGDRGNGNVWFDGGGVVLAAAHNTKPSDAPVTVIFELLRQHEGTSSSRPTSPRPRPARRPTSRT